MRVLPFATAAVLAGCAAPLPPPDGNVHITLDISGRVERTGVSFAAPADATQGCIHPHRARLPTAQGPAPAASDPPNYVFGYAVSYGPRLLSDGRAQASPEWAIYGPQHRFTLDILPLPGALEAEGPVRIGRAFRISVGTPEGLWERRGEEDTPRAEARIAIAPDGMSGRFRVTGLVRQIPHNRLPEDEAITVSGTWRCPARS